MECLINDISKLDLGSPREDSSSKPLSIVSQARPLMMPMEDDSPTVSAVSSDSFDRVSSIGSDNVQNRDSGSGKDLDVVFDPLPSGIVYCG
ncbi:hypothetical protein TSMEX_003776, partial [Taenia solium]|eukprot:TsM_001225100 transcript=TsM_001225100 gene=TsM_001225100